MTGENQAGGEGTSGRLSNLLDQGVRSLHGEVHRRKGLSTKKTGRREIVQSVQKERTYAHTLKRKTSAGTAGTLKKLRVHLLKQVL